MPNHLSVTRRSLAPGEQATAPGGPAAVFVLEGTCRVATNELATGEAALLMPGASFTNQSAKLVTVLIFALTAGGPVAEALACEEIADVGIPCLLRLDEVSFPPGAVAWRHVHPGPGFRVLRRGALHLEADDHTFDAAPGDVWFEAANSPVRATASQEHPETRFVRFMVLPPKYLGKPTIRILDPDDAARPKRQTTLRHLDEIVGAPFQDDAG